MDRQSERKIILVKRKTRLDELIARYNTILQAQFYIEHMGADFSDYQNEHRQYYESVRLVQTSLASFGRVQLIDRTFLSNFIFGKDDIVVAVGQDGLMANTLKYLNGQPLVGVNPDPARWDGVLLPFQAGDIPKFFPDLVKGKFRFKEVSMGRVTLNDGQTLLAVNDFFIGQKSHISARYKIMIGGRSEAQSSSGIVVSTGLGASGWLKSILAGAAGIANSTIKQKLNLKPSDKFTWDSDYLCYSVREPFPSRTTSADMVFGTINNQNPMLVQSYMGENGVIFSDGVEHDFLTFNSGMEAKVTVADHKGILVKD